MRVSRFSERQFTAKGFQTTETKNEASLSSFIMNLILSILDIFSFCSARLSAREHITKLRFKNLYFLCVNGQVQKEFDAKVFASEKLAGIARKMYLIANHFLI